jgi:hypothetical protein
MPSMTITNAWGSICLCLYFIMPPKTFQTDVGVFGRTILLLAPKVHTLQVNVLPVFQAAYRRFLNPGKPI